MSQRAGFFSNDGGEKQKPAMISGVEMTERHGGIGTSRESERDTHSEGGEMDQSC